MLAGLVLAMQGKMAKELGGCNLCSYLKSYKVAWLNSQVSYLTTYNYGNGGGGSGGGGSGGRREWWRWECMMGGGSGGKWEW